MDQPDELIDELYDSGLLPCESHSISHPSSELNLYSSFIGKMDKKTYFFRKLTQTECLYSPEEAKQYADNLKAHYNNKTVSFGGNADSLPLINLTDIISESDIKKRKYLNILITGELKSGKSTFLNKIITKLQKETKFKHSFNPSEAYSTKRIHVFYNDSIQSRITLIEGQGLGSKKEQNCKAYVQGIKHEVFSRNSAHSNKSFFNRKIEEDDRIHIVVFFLKESSLHCSNDALTAIKLLSQWMNVVPIISKKETILSVNSNKDDFFSAKQTLREILKYNQITILDISEEKMSRTSKEKEEDLSPPFEFSIDSSNSKRNSPEEGDFAKVYYLIFHFYPFSIYKNQFYSKYQENMTKVTMKSNNIVIEKNIFYPLTFGAAFIYLLYYFKHRNLS